MAVHCLAASANYQPISQHSGTVCALWDEMIMQHISALILSYPSVRALSLGIDVFGGLLLCSSHKPEAGGPTVAYARAHMGSNTVLRSCINPLVAGVDHLPAGMPMACNLKYLLSVIMTRRHEQCSLLRGCLGNFPLASFCLSVSIGTTFAVRCCSPFLFSRRMTVLALNFRPNAC